MDLLRVEQVVEQERGRGTRDDDDNDDQERGPSLGYSMARAATVVGFSEQRQSKRKNETFKQFRSGEQSGTENGSLVGGIPAWPDRIPGKQRQSQSGHPSVGPAQVCR